MDNIQRFRPSRTIQTASSTIYIGELDGQHAIYTLPLPTITREEFAARTLCRGGRLVLTAKVVPRLVYPATERHIAKYTSRGTYRRETYEEYRANDDFLKTSWLDNLAGAGRRAAACEEQVLFENGHYIIIADYKWDRKSSSSLYLLLVFKDDRYRSLREIDDAELLAAARGDICRLCRSLGVAEHELCMFFHYRPSYFRAHIHVVNISGSLKALGAPLRNVLLDDVIKNLRIDAEYYRGERFVIMLSAD